MHSTTLTRFEHLLKTEVNQSLSDCPPQLKQSITYSLVEVAGKRIRPLLVYESAQSLGLSMEFVDPVALAVEAIHCFSLIHDDLPSLDNDDFRRGQPSNHKVYGEGMALLAGDALLNLAYVWFSKLHAHVKPEIFLNALLYFQKCVGHSGMIGGQALELETGQSHQSDSQLIFKIYEKKTGALFDAAICIPALLASSQDTHRTFQVYGDFSSLFGLAFQLADDYDDQSLDPEQLQKINNTLLPKLKSHLLTQNFTWAQWMINKLEHPLQSHTKQ